MTLLACCWSVPLLACFMIGQDVQLVVMLAAVSLALLFRGKHFLAGCVFSLCLIKFNLFLSLPLLIIGKRLWKFGGGLAAGGAVLLAISFGVEGWSWPWHYAAILRLPSTTPSYSGMPNLNGLVSGWPNKELLEALGACLTLAAAWIVIRGQELRSGIAAMFISGLLISHHGFFQDAFVLVPAGLCMIECQTHGLNRVMAAFLLSPIAYLPFLLPASALPPATVVAIPLFVLAARTILTRRTVPAPERLQPIGIS
jgi:glycosyl transferase family 87